MTPEHVSLITALISLLKIINVWPFAMFFFLLIIGPWLLSLLLARQQERRFVVAVQMYEDNVKLVKNYERLANDLKEVVVMNTQAMTRACDRMARRSE